MERLRSLLWRGGDWYEKCRQRHDGEAEEDYQKADGGYNVKKGRMVIYWLYRVNVYLISYVCLGRA